MKRSLLILVLIAYLIPVSKADEGMWLPLLLKSLNEAEMQSMGMKMTAEDIYSVNSGSLKDAIVHFGGFCTSEVISDNGLLLTNHHCGYGQIQNHTTLKNNYLEDGFWAKDRSEELPNPGLTATFIEYIEDVTKKVLKGTDAPNLTEKERQSLIDGNISKLKNEMGLKSYQDVVVRPFFKGNQYFMFVTVTYRDVRLVGAPPSSIGKFGADTDNWEWPRHTGDFALFRIYANKNNLPADYSEDNIPYTPKHFLPISISGVEENDFTLVFGFPGRTDQYLPSVAVEQLVDVLNPAKIGIRDKALKIIDAEMRANKQVKIQYASKFASIANYWKKWKGESQGLIETNAIDKKQKREKDFMSVVDKNRMLNRKYGLLLKKFEKEYKDIEPYALTRDYYGEVFGRNVDLFRMTAYLNTLVERYEKNGESAYNDYKDRLLDYMRGVYKNYRASIDQKVFGELLELYVLGVPLKKVTQPIANARIQYKVDDFKGLADKLFNETFIKDFDLIVEVFERSPEAAVKLIKEDPAYIFGMEVRNAYNEHAAAKYNEIRPRIDELQRKYMEALMEVFPNDRFFPDANGTMRVTYGNVKGYKSNDGKRQYHQTFLDGVMKKYVPGDYEFDVPKKLIELHENKDYGRYKDDKGRMPVCFLGSNHTTGGNSGSPVIDANGNLIGLNFDRVWEGTMSDINYDPRICRNIMVDARYILFIIDKFAGAEHLIKEMKIVRPKAQRSIESTIQKPKQAPLKKGIRKKRDVKTEKY